MGHGLDEHCLASSWRSVQEHAPRWVDAYLTVEVKLRKWQLDRFTDLLLLDVETANVGVLDVRPLVCGQPVVCRGSCRIEGGDEGTRYGLRLQKDYISSRVAPLSKDEAANRARRLCALTC